MRKNLRPKQALIKVTGRVQGVFYRAHAQDKAIELKLTGYAKNMPDGSVEMLIQGYEDNIKKLIDWCHDGSPSATVNMVKVEWGEIAHPFQDFKIS